MTELLTYEWKVAALLVVFYMFYRLLLSRETFHRLNRVVLLLTAVASFVLPLCVVTIHRTVSVPMPAQPVVEAEVPITVEAAAPQQPWWQVALVALFTAGAVLTLGHTLLSLFRVWCLISRSQQHPQADGTVVCVTDLPLSPFSWMHYIVLSRSDYEQPDEIILQHERAHIRLHHSADLLLVDTLTALQWFNPAIWMLRQDLRAVHEYEADAAVLSQGINVRQYQYLLIRKAASSGGYSIANGINHSTLKNRINMMLHKKSSPRRALRVLALLPVVAVALALNARTVSSFVYDEPQNPVKKGQKAGTIRIGGKDIDVVADTTTTPSSSTQFNLHGLVCDANTQQPVIGATIRIRGSRKGCVSDANGRFTIEVGTNDWLEVAYVGLRTSMVPVSVHSHATTGEEVQILLFPEDSSEPFDVCEVMPEFPGGIEKLMTFLYTSIHYPVAAMQAGTQGRVIVNFVVNKDGSISDQRIVRSISPELDAEALRVVGSMPNWTPGTQNDKPVRVKYTLPITFCLKGDESPSSTAADQLQNTTEGTVAEVAVTSAASTKQETGETTGTLNPLPDNWVLIVDGKEAPVEQLGQLAPSQIEAIAVDKQNPDKPVLRVTTKKDKDKKK